MVNGKLSLKMMGQWHIMTTTLWRQYYHVRQKPYLKTARIASIFGNFNTLSIGWIAVIFRDLVRVLGITPTDFFAKNV